MVPELPIDIERGTSLDVTLHWWGGGRFMAPIEDIITGYPTQIKVTGHQINNVSAPPVIISGVNATEDDGESFREMRNINSKDTRIDMGTYVDADWFTMPVATTGEVWYPGSGEITHYLPSDLTGWGGECRIRKNWHSAVLHTISTALGTMTLTATDGSCRLQINSDVTDTFEITHGVYDIDLWPNDAGSRPVDGSTIMRIFKGPVYLYRDI
jgi:hypothetical protein